MTPAETDIHGDAWVARLRAQHGTLGTACACGNGTTTALALPDKPLTLDGMYCIAPACLVCRHAQAHELLVNDETTTDYAWGEAVL